MSTLYSKEEKEKLLRLYEEEAEAHLTLYTSGKDDYAYERYLQIMNYVREIRKSLNS